jgi:hypothetical protein
MPDTSTQPTSLFTKLTNYCQGRHTFFISFFSVVGIGLHWFGKLDQNFTNFVTVMMGFVFAHSAKESYFESKDKQTQ